VQRKTKKSLAIDDTAAPILDNLFQKLFFQSEKSLGYSLLAEIIIFGAFSSVEFVLG
jgi:hypothetical protein